MSGMKEQKVFFVNCEKCGVKSFEDTDSSALDHRLVKKKWKRVKSSYTCPKCNGW